MGSQVDRPYVNQHPNLLGSLVGSLLGSPHMNPAIFNAFRLSHWTAHYRTIITTNFPALLATLISTIIEPIFERIKSTNFTADYASIVKANPDKGADAGRHRVSDLKCSFCIFPKSYSCL